MNRRRRSGRGFNSLGRSLERPRPFVRTADGSEHPTRLGELLRAHGQLATEAGRRAPLAVVFREFQEIAS